MESGAQCVMIAGISMMRTWCVANLASPAPPPRLTERHTARELVPSGWRKLDVKEERLRFLTVLKVVGEYITVITMKMQVLFAKHRCLMAIRVQWLPVVHEMRSLNRFSEILEENLDVNG